MCQRTVLLVSSGVHLHVAGYFTLLTSHLTFSAGVHVFLWLGVREGFALERQVFSWPGGDRKTPPVKECREECIGRLAEACCDNLPHWTKLVYSSHLSKSSGFLSFTHFLVCSVALVPVVPCLDSSCSTTSNYSCPYFLPSTASHFVLLSTVQLALFQKWW